MYRGPVRQLALYLPDRGHRPPRFGRKCLPRKSATGWRKHLSLVNKQKSVLLVAKTSKTLVIYRISFLSTYKPIGSHNKFKLTGAIILLSNSFENHPNLPLFRLKSREKRGEDKFSLFPLDGANGLGSQIQQDAVDAGNLVGDPVGMWCRMG